MKALLGFIKRRPFLSSFFAVGNTGCGCTFCIYIGNMIQYDHSFRIRDFFELVVLGLLIGVFLCYPVLLSLLNLIFLFVPAKCGKIFEYVTILWGAFCCIMYAGVSDIIFDADWTQVLYNQEKHAPFDMQSYPTLIVIAVVAAIGYLILSFMPLQKLPPLVTVLSISAMYLGIAESCLCCIQLWSEPLFVLYGANLILIAVKVIVWKIKEWNRNRYEESAQKLYKNPLLLFCSRILCKSSSWPFLAFLLMWPLFGILVCILVLFGQQPDSFIKAFTETSDWSLSQRVAPQNLYRDEHYLCTVAAGGHEKVVKPVRMGVRHGHKVIVNRQLMIANAFEQLLEEKTPRLHRHIRHFYDTYGFPIAKLIRSRYVADVVYVIMKPLEWLFLIVLYLCDVKPENRIAVQYLPKIGAPI